MPHQAYSCDSRRTLKLAAGRLELEGTPIYVDLKQLFSGLSARS